MGESAVRLYLSSFLNSNFKFPSQILENEKMRKMNRILQEHRSNKMIKWSFYTHIGLA